MKILGIDEAGRGAVVGPLVIAGTLFDESKFGKLYKLKLKDSKELSRNQRENLEISIKNLTDDFIVIQIPARKIDQLREIRNLNRIEIDHMADITNALKPDKLIIDSVEANTGKIKKEILGKLENKDIELVVENYADKNYPVVSAASILAKVVRDKSVSLLEDQVKNKYGIIGSGYPSDPRTVQFLKNILEKDKKYPEFIRKSWFTAKKINGDHKQRILFDFSSSEEMNNSGKEEK
jgi:ribonuclease HII